MHTPDLFRLISEYFWVIGLAFGLFNYWKVRRAVARDVPRGGLALENTLRSLRGFAWAGLSPWLLMGIGQLSGAAPSIWYYFRPQDGNPFVVVWFVWGFLVAVTYASWICFGDGLPRVRQLHLMQLMGHHGSQQHSERTIKLRALGSALVIPVWVCLVISMNAQVPK